jgi:nucleoside-diphosphate-sugar epimerase
MPGTASTSYCPSYATTCRHHGARFIGSHLAETLLDRGYSVIGIDNLLTGDIANIAHLTNRAFEFIKHDVTNYIYIDGPVDYVLHWASPASPIDYLESADSDAESRRARHATRRWAGQGQGRPVRAGVDFRGLR